MEKMDVESTKPEKMDTDSKSEKMFTLKKWNAVAMWSWDVECDTCAICRVQVMGKYIECVDILYFSVRFYGDCLILQPFNKFSTANKNF